MQEIKIRKNEYAQDFTVTIHETFTPDQKARLAIDMVSKWGMVGGKESGEDSAGRMKIVPMDEAELVNRAIKVSELVFQAIEDKKWFTRSPTIKDIEENNFNCPAQ